MKVVLAKKSFFVIHNQLRTLNERFLLHSDYYALIFWLPFLEMQGQIEDPCHIRYEHVAGGEAESDRGLG